jgi:ATP-binding protein involved in chromosome partitioning
MLNKKDIIRVLMSISVSDNSRNIIDDKIVGKIEIVHDAKIIIFLSLDTNWTRSMNMRNKIKNFIIQAIHKNINPDIQVFFTIQERKNIHITNCKHIIGVASGKGGVGKSTIASNIAVGLAHKGYNVCLFDADFYGPSIPLMFDTMTSKLSYEENIKGLKKIYPIVNYGVKLLSLGFIVDIDQAVALRGPMLSKILKQLIMNTELGDLDFLIIDLPPGTGDIHISIMKYLSVNGIVIVSTPQITALCDVRRSISMLQIPSINIPIIGIVENMSYFSPVGDKKKYYLFGKKGVENLSLDLKINFLGHIPIYQSIRESSDFGRPAILQSNTKIASYFHYIVDNLLDKVKI